uniref:Endonuclease/exonuclease/phosphatase domain-containing protein n=1 Tax=Gadus morhua TaxID=8049 RepID=A0A8C5CRE6_GADMO
NERVHSNVHQAVIQYVQLTQEIVDKDGRYIIILGFLHNIKCTLVNVYAPNIGQAKFLSRLKVILSQFSADPIFIGGDFNLVSDPAVDRSSPPLPSDRTLSVAFRELKKSLAMSEIWRVVNPCVPE